jgi:hypothetical protein
MNVVLNDEVLAKMEENGVTEDDVKEVVEYAESTKKLYDEETGKNLGKKKLDAITVYAEYTVDGDTAEVTNVYRTRVYLEEDM